MNVLGNVDNVHFVSIFCQRIKVICFLIGVNKKYFKSGKSKSQGKLKLKNNGHPVEIMDFKIFDLVFTICKANML